MWKFAVVTVIAVVLGALGGVGVVQALNGPALALAQKDKDEALKQFEALKEQNRKAATENEALKKQNESLEARLRLAERDATAAAETPAPEAAAPVEVAKAEDPKPADADAKDAQTAPPDWRGRRDRGEGEGEADAATREERRQEFMTQMRSRMDEMTNAELSKYANDPVAQQRITNINDQLNTMMDLRQQMRDAQTDEERDAIRESMAQTGENLRNLTEEQQDYMLRQVASQYGITNQNQQDQFIQSMKDTQDSPYFRGPRMFGGFGGRGGPGGFGGPGGGFGGQPQQAPQR